MSGTGRSRPDEVLERAPAMFLEATGAPLVGTPRVQADARELIGADEVLAELVPRGR